MIILGELTELRNRAWKTSGARYNAARRLRTRSKLSLATISLISAIGVAIPLLVTSDLFDSSKAELGLYSALLSLFILVVAIIEGAAGFDAKADALFRNAESLNAFRLKLNVWLADAASQTVANLADATAEYEQIKSTCPINHEVVDFDLHRATYPSDYGLPKSWYRKWLANGHSLLYSSWWLSLIAVAAIAGLWKVLG